MARLREKLTLKSCTSVHSLIYSFIWSYYLFYEDILNVLGIIKWNIKTHDIIIFLIMVGWVT